MSEEKETENTVETRLTAIESLLVKFAAQFSNTERTVNVIKQFNEDTYTVIEPLYIAYGEVDGHGDAYKNEDAVYQLTKAINEANEAGTLQPSWFHVCKAKSFTIGQAYVNEEEAMLGDHKIPRLQPLIEITFKSKKAFDARKEGRITGLSIGALGTVEVVKSLLDDLKGTVKPQRLLSNFSFAHRGAHLAYTDPSVGGPASLKDWVIEKSMTKKVNKNQADLLEDLEEEYVELDKKLFDDAYVETAPSTSENTEAVNAGVDNENVNKGKESEMSEEIQKENAELKKQLAAIKLEKSLVKYALEDELTSELSTVLVELDDSGRASVLKVLDAVIAASEVKVTEAKEAKDAAEAELTKAKESPVVQNELAKMLSTEAGQAEPVAKSNSGLSLAQQVSATNIEKAKQQ